MKLSRVHFVKGAVSPESLMLKVKRGDRAAFAELYDRFKGPIFNYLLGMVGRDAQAEELAHEVFLRVYRARDSYEPTARFTTWLWTLARNAAFDELRKKGEVLAGGMDIPSPVDLLTDPDQGPEAKLVEQARRDQVVRCLSALPPRQREAVLLRAQGERTYEEIAEVLGESLANVKNLLHRAKKALADCLEGTSA